MKAKASTEPISSGLYDKIMSAYAAIRAYVRQQINDAVSTAFKFKGTVATYYDLPECDSMDSIETCPEIGDTYNVIAAYDSEEFGEVPPGTNWAWNGEKWDPLGGDMSDYLRKETADATYATKESLTAGLAGKADKADAILAPIYEGGHTEPFSEWLFDKPAFVVIGDFGFNASSGEWVIEFGDQQAPYSYTGEVSGTLNDTEVVFDYSEGLGVIITATRTAYALTSYRLGPSDGPNADKPLQPAGSYATKEEVALVRDVDNDSATQVQTKEDPITLGTGNAALSANSLAEGASNTAGLKGYRYTNTKPVANSLTFEVTPDGWAAGDFVSIINGSKYADCAVIGRISGNTVTFLKDLPFSSIASDTGWDAKIAYVSTKPDKGNVDLGYGAHAEGIGSKALNAAAHAEGRKTQALGQYSHAEGRETKAQYCAHAEGEGTEAVGTRSHAEGQGTRANNNYAHAEGLWTVAGGEASHSEGSGAEARGAVAHAEGINTQAIGDYSHAEGESTTAEGSRSHSEGIGTLAAGHFSHAEGANAVTGTAAKKDSRGETADGCFAHAEGNGTYAKGAASHAEGWETQAHGRASHAEGNYTQALNFYEHAEGQLNKSNKASNNFGDSGNTLHSIGIGFGSTRMNAVEVMQDGKAYVKDIGGYDGTNPGGNRDLATVLAAMASTASIESTDRAALHALTELDSTTDLQATKDTINTLMKVLKALVPAASVVLAMVAPIFGATSLNNLNPTNEVYTAGEVNEYVATQALSRAEAEAGFTEWEPYGDDPGYTLISATYSSGVWTVVILQDGYLNPASYIVIDEENVTSLAFHGDLNSIVRTRLRPTPEMEASWDAKASTNDLELVPVFTAWTILRDGVDVTAQVQQPYYETDPDAAYVNVWFIMHSYISGDGGLYIDDSRPDAVALSWTGFDQGSSPHAYTATRSVVAYHMADQPTKDMATPDGVAKAIADAEAEARQWAEWFPDGEASSIADCTTNLKFDWANVDSVNRTIYLFPFCDTGTAAANDNSDISGRVVIPPYVETNGVRYVVVGVHEGSPDGQNTGLAGIVAPTTITTIEYGAFYNCAALTSVSLPAATIIGASGFENCTSLTSVSFPAATGIEDYAFYGCDALASVDFGATLSPVPTLGTDAFPILSSHTCRIIVPDDNYAAWTTNQNWNTLTSQGYEFVRWSDTQPATKEYVDFSITEAEQFREWFPDGTITSYDQCTQNLKFDWAHATNNTVKVLAFASDGVTPSNGDAVGDIIIPPYVETNGVRYAVTAIGAYGDQGPPSGAAITSLKAPTTVTQIGNGAFHSCDALASVSLPAATAVLKFTFYGCEALTSVSLPAATNIRDSAFSSCNSLTSVSLPAVTNIRDYAFFDCASLTSVDFGPNARQDVPSLGDSAFSDLYGRTCRIIVPGGQYDNWTAASGWSALVSQGYEFVRWSDTQPATKEYVDAGLAGKQDAIADLATIRSGAALGATAVQPADLASAVRYGLVEITANPGTLSDRAVNSATIANAGTFVLPAAVSGRARDLMLSLTVTLSASIAVNFFESGGPTPITILFGSSELSKISQGRNLICFTEVAANQWLVSVRHEDFTAAELAALEGGNE